MSIGFLLWQNNTDNIIEGKLPQLSAPTSPKPKQQFLLNCEKHIYLFVFFLSDVISIFEITNIIALGSIYFPYLPIKTMIFIGACLYALYIHLNCRLPDYDERYTKLSKIVNRNDFKLKIQSAVAALLIGISFYLAISLPPSSGYAILSLGSASILSLKFYNEAMRLPYGIYLNIFAYKQIKTFSFLFLEQTALFQFIAPLPQVIKVADYAFMGLGSLYSLAYLNSTVRTLSMKALPN